MAPVAGGFRVMLYVQGDSWTSSCGGFCEVVHARPGSPNRPPATAGGLPVLQSLEMVLGLSKGSITAIEMDKTIGAIDVTIADVVFAPDAEVQAFQTLHDCEGRRWYRTQVVIPEPVARVVTIPA